MKKLFYLFLLLCGTFTLQAATITVTSGADAGAGTLRAAITSAVAGDDIVFSGVTTVTLTSEELLISKNLTINGGTGVTVTRSGATEFRIFSISSATVVLNKLSITNGKNAASAGGVLNGGNLTFNDCTIANNESQQGGGLQNTGTMMLNRCFVHSNKGGLGGGLIIFGTTTTLNNCVFTNNMGGGAIRMQSSGTLTITNCTIAKNATTGIIGNSSAVVTLKNTIVAENAGNIDGNVSASSAYNLIGTEGANGGLINGTNNNKVGVLPFFANSSDPDGADNIFGTADDGLRLTTCNLATNVGNNADAPAGTDIAGNPRIFATTVDIGAYEFQANSIAAATIILGTIPAILAGTTTFILPYTTTTGTPTTYSVSGTGITTVTDAALSNSPITVNLSPAPSSNLSFTLTVKNAGGCTYSITGSVTVIQNMTWTGAVSTDWHTPNNWSPIGVPTAVNRVTIPNVANKPVVLSGATATCLSIGIAASSSLTINTGGTMILLPTDERGTAIYINSKGTLTNNGTLSCTATGIIDGMALPDSTTFNNNGTATFSMIAANILLGGPNTRLNNSATGIINIQAGTGIRTLTGAERIGTIITNQGVINYSGSGFGIRLNPNYTFNNSGTIHITRGAGLYNEGGILNNLACGKIFISNTSDGLLNSATGGVVNNAGLIVTNVINNTNGTFNNTGVTNRLPTTGTVTNTGNGAVDVRHNTYPIFAYGGTFNGTVNGIFTDSLATVSAGTFTAPFNFTPLATLPRGVQTLYVKITPSGGTCTYIVPFSYNTLTSSISKIDVQTVVLNQNRPNPFSQETIISFNLPETHNATLTVYDITGKQVFSANKTFNAGINEVVLNKSVFKSAGMYVYRLTSDTFNVVKRMQFVAE